MSRLRENFIERIFVYQRWRDTVLSPMTLAALVDFHSRHKLLLMSHGQAKARQLGRIVAQAHQGPLYDSIMRYQDMMMKALKQLSTAKKQCNVLQHALGYFKKDIDALEKAELLKLIEQHAQGHVPLIAPVTLLNHYIRKYPKPYLASQCWPWPQPLELAAPSHV